MPSLFNQQKQIPKAILPWGILDEISYRDSNYCLTFVLDKRTTLKGYIILDDLWQEYYSYSKLNKAESTCSDDRSKYTKHIQPYFGNRLIRDISAIDINDWQEHLTNNYAHNTVRNIHKVFNKILVFADIIYNTDWIPTVR